ncbi:MAG: RloB domain-containing protein [Verrucomicrobiae bacterium]|nr:RloB domain-containing protein [Verrucomicrobiae bacterium]
MGFKPRKTSFRKQKRLYVVSTEGAQTEPTYLGLFTPGRDGEFRLRIIGNPKHESAPVHVVQRLFDFEKANKPGTNTEYWALIDRDSWDETALSEANRMVRTRDNFHLAMSNPCFELWLYLHLRENKMFADRRDCLRSLGEIWPEYKKSGYDPGYVRDGIADAIRRAKDLEEDAPGGEPWPTGQGTHVYRLIEKF